MSDRIGSCWIVSDRVKSRSFRRELFKCAGASRGIALFPGRLCHLSFIAFYTHNAPRFIYTRRHLAGLFPVNLINRVISRVRDNNNNNNNNNKRHYNKNRRIINIFLTKIFLIKNNDYECIKNFFVINTDKKTLFQLFGEGNSLIIVIDEGNFSFLCSLISPRFISENIFTVFKMFHCGCRGFECKTIMSNRNRIFLIYNCRGNRISLTGNCYEHPK